MRNAAKLGVVVAVLILGMTRSSGYLEGTIALSGDPNPRGGTFQSFSSPLINALGQVAFVADEPGGASPTLYRYDYGTGSLSTVYEFGADCCLDVAINDQGDIVFGQGFSTSFVRWNNGVTTPIVSAGDPTPLGGTFTAFWGLPRTQGPLNNQGALVFVASYLTPEGASSFGIFVGDGVTTRAVAVFGEDSTPVGGVFSFNSSYHDPVMNDNGDVLFWADVTGGSALAGLFLSRGGSFSTVMTAGQPTPIGSAYAANPGGYLHSMNNAGEIAFEADLEDGRHALFRWNNGVTTKAVSSDDIAPSGASFLGLQRPVLNQSGALAFAAAGIPHESLHVEYQGVIRTILSGADLRIFQAVFDFNDRGDFVVSNGGGLFFLRAQADLVVTKTDDPDPVTVGSPLTYTAAVTNNGPDRAFGVTFTDTLPASVTHVSSSTTKGSCSGASSVTCDIGTLEPGEVATVTIVVSPTAEGGLLNTATVTSLAQDDVPANNTDSEATAVVALPPPPPPPAESVGGSVTGLGSIHVECRNLSRRRRQAGAFVAFDLPPGVISWDCEAQGLIVTPGDQIEIRVTAVAN